jgi:hypothetical protein
MAAGHRPTTGLRGPAPLDQKDRAIDDGHRTYPAYDGARPGRTHLELQISAARWPGA